MTESYCPICDEYDTFRTNNDIGWCAECGDTETIQFIETEESE